MILSRKLIVQKTGPLLKRAISDPRDHVFQRMIRVGETIPESVLFEDYPTNAVQLNDLLIERNAVMFGVPGAFTPGCSRTHLPGYINAAEQMKNEGVDEIICVAVNDPYVMAAWAEKNHTKGKVRLLADPNGEFIRAIGLGMTISALGGYRAKRFSMYITNNVIRELNIEPDGTGLSCSLASRLDYKKYKKYRKLDGTPEGEKLNKL